MLEYKCDLCGRLSSIKYKAEEMIVCRKHYNQFKNYGCFKDTSNRTHMDKNNITIVGDTAYIDLYDKHYNVIAKAIIDADDVDNIKHIKWGLSSNGYVYNHNSRKHICIYLHRRILNCDTTVDHINGNRLDNRKCNLRICTSSQNHMNSYHRGITKRGNKWTACIKLNGNRAYLGSFVYEEEALYARWYSEQLVFKEFAYPKPEPEILESRKEEIKELVKYKTQKLCNTI